MTQTEGEAAGEADKIKKNSYIFHTLRNVCTIQRRVFS